MNIIDTSALKRLGKSYERPALKQYFVLIGLRALSEGDMARVQLITELLRKAVRDG